MDSMSAATSAPSDRSPGHHTWGRSPGPVPNEPAHDGRHFPTHLRHCRRWNRPESAMEADGEVRISSPDFSSVSPPNRSSTRSRQKCKRDLRGVEAIKYAGSTTGPVIASAPPSKVKNFGIDQNTEETLPNFRQKSKEI
ncbi:hypothetical protein Prudu_016953 [Prunus dulcis]|uniref:Uncharacterized protein n=1 Tax=Prunus dulcis TaxID=3755 RepID=A0A4Y1RMV2_PRUDU|nr:hypothetical protein Prudu_016953 [Prunus dulcis]